MRQTGTKYPRPILGRDHYTISSSVAVWCKTRNFKFCSPNSNQMRSTDQSYDVARKLVQVLSFSPGSFSNSLGAKPLSPALLDWNTFQIYKDSQHKSCLPTSRFVLESMFFELPAFHSRCIKISEELYYVQWRSLSHIGSAASVKGL